MLRWCGLKPDGLPYATAGSVPYHAAPIQRLLADRNLRTIHICRVEDMNDTMEESVLSLLSMG